MTKTGPQRRLADVVSTTPPGLDGTYWGSCVGCLRGCDTCVAVVGDVDWHCAFLTVIGVPLEEAEAMIQAPWFPILAPDFPPVFYRVCTACAAKYPRLTARVAVPGADVPGGLPAPRGAFLNLP